MKFLLNPIIVLLSTILLYLGYSPFGIWIFGWVGLVPFILFNINQKSTKKAIIFSWLFGCLFYLIGVFWIRHVTILGYFVASFFVLGPYFLLYSIVIRGVYKSGFTIKFCLLAAFSWVGLEALHSYCILGLPWFNLGYTQYRLVPLIQSADLFGVYGISFIVILINLTIAGIINSQDIKKIKKLSILTVSLLICMMLYGIIREKGINFKPGEKALLVQGNIPQELKEVNQHQDEILKKHLELTYKGIKEENPDIIIWPETMFPYVMREQGDVINYVSQMVNFRFGKYFLMGCIGANDKEGGSDYYNSAFLFSNKGEFIGRYDKINLVLLSEKIPFEEKSDFIKNIIKKTTGLQDLYGLKAGKSVKVLKGPENKFGILICFESAFPQLSLDNVRKGADYLINISNDGWFKDSYELNQIFVLTQFRAIETRRAILRVANTGISGVIYPDGKYTCLTDKQGKSKEISGVLPTIIPICSSISLYLILGDFLPLISMMILFVLLLGIFMRFRLKKT